MKPEENRVSVCFPPLNGKKVKKKKVNYNDEGGRYSENKAVNLWGKKCRYSEIKITDLHEKTLLSSEFLPLSRFALIFMFKLTKLQQVKT